MSLPGRVHISEQTAAEIQRLGHGEIVTPRKELIEAKGKGILRTFWLKTGDEESETEPARLEIGDLLGASQHGAPTNETVSRSEAKDHSKSGMNDVITEDSYSSEQTGVDGEAPRSKGAQSEGNEIEKLEQESQRV